MCFRIKCTSNLSIDLKAHPDRKSFQCDFLFPIYPSYKLILPSIDLSFVLCCSLQRHDLIYKIYSVWNMHHDFIIKATQVVSWIISGLNFDVIVWLFFNVALIAIIFLILCLCIKSLTGILGGSRSDWCIK